MIIKWWFRWWNGESWPWNFHKRDVSWYYRRYKPPVIWTGEAECIGAWCSRYSVPHKDTPRT